MLTGMPSTRDGEIGAVVEIEAAQKILVGFALAGMLGDDQPRHASSTSPTREDGRAFTSSPLMWRFAGGGGLQVCRPGGRGAGRYTAVTCGGTAARLNGGWVLRGLLTARRLGRLRSFASDDVTVTAGSWPDAGSATF